jgi:flagellar FliL protein
MPTPEAVPVPAPSPSKLPTILGLANALLTAGVLAVLLTRPVGGATSAPAAEGHEAAAAAHEGEAGGAGPTLKMADFVIHLRNPEAERFARLSVELELVAEPDREKLTQYVPRLRDAFVAYLSDRTSEELSGSEALGRTKAALLKQCEELVPGKHIKALYFTDFVVQ